MFAHVKIYSKKKVPLLKKKVKHTKTKKLYKHIQPKFFLNINIYVIFQFLAPTVGYFARMDLKQKWKCTIFWVSLIQNKTLLMKKNISLK